MAGNNSKRQSSRSRKKQEEIKTDSVVTDIVLWAILAMSVLLFIGNLGLGGFIGGAVASVMFGLFGILAYVVPILICVGAFFLISNRENKIAYRKVGCGFLLLILLDLLIELFRNGSIAIGPVLAYNDGASGHVGGGFFGGFLALILTTGFGLVGAYVIDVVLMIVSTVLITEKSLFNRLKEYSDNRQKAAKSRRLENRLAADKRLTAKKESYKEEVQPERRMDKKASGSGLNLDLLTINGIPTKSDEVTPIDEESYAKMHEEDKNAPEFEKVPLNSNEPSVSTFKVNTPYQDMEEITDDEPAFGYPEAADEVTEITAPESSYEPVYEESYQTDEAAPISEPEEIYPDASESYETSESVSGYKSDTGQAQQTPPEGSLTTQTAASQQVAPKPAPPKPKPKKPYVLPTVDLLSPPKSKGSGDSAESVQETAMMLQNTLASFGVNVKITEASIGPAVTRYELAPEQGVKVSRIVSLADDIKLNLAAADIRIEAPIPGKAAVGIEVPNKSVVMVPFREMMDSAEFKSNKSLISFAAGKDIGGKIVISDIAKMPHLLIAGATGSGKSVCINTIIMSILYHASPDDVKFIMIDPKVVELSVYNGIPHLMVPVVTDPKKAAAALNWAVKEMTDRYNKFASAGVRDMKGYNSKIKNGMIELGGEKVAASKMPQIVVIVDELADLMMVASGEVEEAICRLAQLARAAGIHLIIATQRPSVNVITGLIKANMPSRIAFAVTSGIDSRTILDMNGAEKLLGKGDMLYYPQGAPKPMRVQGAFVDDSEVESVCNFIRAQGYGDEDTSEIQQAMEAASAESSGATQIGQDAAEDDGRDAYFADAGRFIIDKEKASIGLLQRNFKIGFNRAARIMDQLAEAGVVGPEEGTKPRKILLSAEEFEAVINS